jgi:hypothetical protein|tara:strand:- start:1224 stop:1412 length:189 start_codon:yes stop_codon:yes gene_type:complete
MDLYIYDRIVNILKERQRSLEEQLLYGSVENFEAYKEVRARLSELATLQQEVKLLLKKVEDE